MIDIRLASDRGTANFGWLESKHTFSFGSYHDPKHMGYSALRVINDDKVEAGAGFGTHGHKDMEILSYVTQGVIAHKDSMGNIKHLPAGEFQLMSAGTGVTHSEYNASDSDILTFLQIWIVPKNTGGAPGYQQKDFGRAQGLTQIITSTGIDDTLQINQDATMSQLILAAGTKLEMDINESRNTYVHQVAGQLSINQQQLKQGDGAKINRVNTITLSNDGTETVTALIFDLP
ncbi:pirin family protein [uncultured Paraglaciecola sp.]|uniref:pirin family protein n=1 Tax=uncultured Paraglaciecola sp. TaxID=1765024 RepID=UPI0030D82DEA|tara:strand:+ start:714 stop:1409 length:696 start_codon:yes stop_codon:yes gene_type:complete